MVKKNIFCIIIEFSAFYNNNIIVVCGVNVHHILFYHVYMYILVLLVCAIMYMYTNIIAFKVCLIWYCHNTVYHKSDCNDCHQLLLPDSSD